MMASEGNIMTKAKLKVVITTPIQRPIYNDQYWRCVDA